MAGLGPWGASLPRLRPFVNGCRLRQTHPMVRWEAAIDTPLGFRDGGVLSSRSAKFVDIEFDGHTYAWHDGVREDERLCWPVVSTKVVGEVNAHQVVTGINRLLSALSFHFDLPMSIDTTAGAGWKDEFDPPLLGQPGYGARQLESALDRVEVRADDRLRLTLALWREGRSARSPAYRYLAYYNALDAAFDDDQHARATFIADQLRHEKLPVGAETRQYGWARYLQDVLRNAVAHAVRPQGRPMLDPDETMDRGALTAGAIKLATLVRSRVEDRWPRPVKVVAARR